MESFFLEKIGGEGVGMGGRNHETSDTCDNKCVSLQVWKLHASIQLAVLKYSCLIFFCLTSYSMLIQVFRYLC